MTSLYVFGNSLIVEKTGRTATVELNIQLHSHCSQVLVFILKLGYV